MGIGDRQRLPRGPRNDMRSIGSDNFCFTSRRDELWHTYLNIQYIQAQNTDRDQPIHSPIAIECAKYNVPTTSSLMKLQFFVLHLKFLVKVSALHPLG
jgi:hypothetical protein